ncbi:MAG: holo-ACP synthase [Planctomycetota bacterium]
MRIIGHGVDLVDKARVERLLAEHGERFLARCFTDAERAYSDGNARRRMEHLAGRFAAKEAVLKVLGTGWSGGIAWTDAEVVREPSGRPTVVLHGRCAEVAAELGITEWWLSISHIETHAVASAIGVAG